MKLRVQSAAAILLAVLSLAGCATSRPAAIDPPSDRGLLIGAWRSKVVFRTGPLAGMRDLEFLYAFNAGGTMTESSNYDEAANSSPPAYGVWRAIDGRRFEAKYVFFTTDKAGPDQGAPKNGDWWPSGYGVLTETLTLSDDRRTYASTIKLNAFDRTGSPVPDGGGEGSGAGARIVF